MIGKSIYEQLKNKTQVELGTKIFKISGVFESSIGFKNGGVVLHIDKAGEIFNKSASMIMINSNIDTNMDQLISSIKKLSYKIDAKSTDNFIDNYNQFEIIETSSYTISFIEFCMGLLGIVSIMSITVNQRKSEFGIKRAIGIPMRKIIYSIVLESFIIGLFSFISAFFISYIILFFIKNSSHLQGYVNGNISSSMTLFIFISSMLMAILGSIAPAINASKIDPVELIQGNKI